MVHGCSCDEVPQHVEPSAMRILSVFQTLSFYGRGVHASEIKVIARHLNAMDHRTTVLAVDYGKLLGDRGEEDGVEMVHLGRVLRLRNLTVSPGVLPFCLRELRSFDIVHIYGLYDLLGPVVSWFCRRWGIPYIVEPLGMYRPLVRNAWMKRLYHRMVGRPHLRGAARFIATSEMERQELLEDGVPLEKVVVRRNGLDMSQFEHLPQRGHFRGELDISSNECLVLYLGRQSRIKGLDLLLKAFAATQEHARLAIVGPDDGDGCVGELERLRTELGLGGRVLMTGPRFGQKKLEALVDADVFALPSQHENFGNAAVEAAACGVPVVVTDRCGVAPHLEGRAALVIPYELEALTTALQTMLTDAQLRERFRASAPAIRRELSWDEPVAQQEKIYEAVVEEAAARRQQR